MSACMDGALGEIALEVVVLAHSHHAFPQCQFYYIVPAMQMQVSPYAGTLFPLPVYPLLIKVHEAVILPSSTDLIRAHTQVVERAGRLDSHLIRLASYIVLPSKWTRAKQAAERHFAWSSRVTSMPSQRPIHRHTCVDSMEEDAAGGFRKEGNPATGPGL